VVASWADDNGVSMREHSADGVAGALHIHEVGVGSSHQALLLVAALLVEDSGVQKVVLDDRHCVITRNTHTKII